MSSLKGKVGSCELEWLAVPHQSNGSALVRINAKDAVEVRWRKDSGGIWIELPDGTFGFDIVRETSDTGQVSYQVLQRGSQLSWNGLSFICHGHDNAVVAGTQQKEIKIRAQMPGKIVRVLVNVGSIVEKDQPLLVMEAMKMENEIRSPQAGKVSQLKVSESQTVESGMDLMVIELEAISK